VQFSKFTFAKTAFFFEKSIAVGFLRPFVGANREACTFKITRHLSKTPNHPSQTQLNIIVIIFKKWKFEIGGLVVGCELDAYTILYIYARARET